MKKQAILFLSLFVLISSLPARAQEQIKISDCLKIERSDGAKWIRRDERAIAAFKAEDAKTKNFSCDVLFVGSSSFRLWSTVKEDMAPLKVINRGYGGSCIRDMLYYYDDIVKPYSPRKIILYVENDFSGSREDLSVGDAYDLFRLFAQKIHADFPNIKFYIVSVKPSFAREKQLPKKIALNALLKDYCDAHEHLVFIDVASRMFNENGELKKEIFASDKLHLNHAGYELWTSVIKPYLMEK